METNSRFHRLHCTPSSEHADNNKTRRCSTVERKQHDVVGTGNHFYVGHLEAEVEFDDQITPIIEQLVVNINIEIKGFQNRPISCTNIRQYNMYVILANNHNVIKVPIIYC